MEFPTSITAVKAPILDPSTTLINPMTKKSPLEESSFSCHCPILHHISLNEIPYRNPKLNLKTYMNTRAGADY